MYSKDACESRHIVPTTEQKLEVKEGVVKR